MEIWRDIKDYEGLYQVSSKGRVKSLERNVIRGRGGLYKIEEKILKNIKNSRGYLQVSLHKEGKIKHHLIHRLVASAFIDNPDNFPQVNHIDEDKTNNMVENLEYCDSRYNTNFGTRNERVGEKHKIRILQFTLDGELVRKWDCAKEVERDLGFDKSNISSCCKGKYNSAYGFKWCYHYKSLWKKNHIPLIKQKKVV